MRRFKLVGLAMMAVMALAVAAPAAICSEAVLSGFLQALASSALSVIVGATGICLSIVLLLPRGKLDLSPPLSLSR